MLTTMNNFVFETDFRLISAQTCLLQNFYTNFSPISFSLANSLSSPLSYPNFVFILCPKPPKQLHVFNSANNFDKIFKLQRKLT